MDERLEGLSVDEVLERRSRGEGEEEAKGITKSRGQIVKENTITLFNILNIIIAILFFGNIGSCGYPLSG